MKEEACMEEGGAGTQVETFMEEGEAGTKEKGGQGQTKETAYNATWLVYTERLSEDVIETDTGGGCCVRSEGIPISTLLKFYEEETFEVTEISTKNLSLEYQEATFSYNHQHGYVYSYGVGLVVYPYPSYAESDSVFPPLSDKLTIQDCIDEQRRRVYKGRGEEVVEDWPFKDLNNNEIRFLTVEYMLRQNFDFRTAGTIADEDEDEVLDLHPRLPLIQLSGIGPARGCSGCPVFLESNKSLIGMLARSIGIFNFAIPLKALRMALAAAPTERPGNLVFEEIDLVKRAKMDMKRQSQKRKGAHGGDCDQKKRSDTKTRELIP